MSTRQRGFSLVELLVAASLSAAILAAVLSAFLFLGETGLRASAYSEMDAQARRGLEIFARDVRRAQDIRWTDRQTVTLLIPASPSPAAITYGYANPSARAGEGIFYRRDASGATQTLVRGVADDFAFQRFKLQQAGAIDAVATNDTETKQILVSMRAARRVGSAAGATQALVSAKHILRNKRVSN